jgi:two-component system sensor histidine kinase TctE
MNSSVTLRRKLLTWLLLPMLILWSVSFAVTYYLAIRFVNYVSDYSLLDSAQDLAGQVVVAGGRVSLDLPKPARQIFLSDKSDTIYFNVLSRSGKVIAGDPDLPLPDGRISPGDSAIRDGMVRRQKVRIARLSILPSGLPPGQSVLIQVAATLNKRNKLARQIITVMILPQFLMIVLVALIVWTGIGKGLAPLKLLRREIASRSHRDLSPVEESRAPHEVLPIIHEINGLMRRLGQAIEAQQRFIADAAHQLRTPLSGLKAQASLALRQSDPESRQHSLEQLSLSTDRTIRLINQMLTLAQVEPGSEKIFDLKLFDLSELLKEATREWVPAALKKDMDLGYEGPVGAVMINGDRIRIKMMIDNLIDNAVRYSPDGSSVTTRIEAAEGSVVLTIEDNGPGIPVGEREAVFQRFYRILGNPVAGSGLGLSIVHEIAASHGAHVSIEDRGGRGTSVKVVFPLRQTISNVETNWPKGFMPLP